MCNPKTGLAMKKLTLPFKAILFCSLGFSLPTILNAQYKWDVGVNIGAANYLGDMGGNELTRRDFVSDMKLSQTRLSTDAFVRYRIARQFSVQGNFGWARISGNDKLSSNPARNARNLNFRNDIIQLTGEAQYFFYEVNDLGHSYRYRNNFRAYVGLGIGAAYHNPKAELDGQWIALRPLETEGFRYTKITGVIPATAGFYFTLNKHYRIGWNLTWNTTFTDYLDDVSTRYVDPSTLSSPTAVKLANRTNELTNITPAFAENFTPGDKRGDPTHNDSYLTSTVDLSYVIRGHSNRTYPSYVKGFSEKARYDWLQRRQNHPDKFNGIKRKLPFLYRIRKHRVIF
jgi:hypothetical protein